MLGEIINIFVVLIAAALILLIVGRLTLGLTVENLSSAVVRLISNTFLPCMKVAGCGSAIIAVLPLASQAEF